MKPSLEIIVVILSFGIEACSATYVLSTDPQQTPYFTTQYMSFDDLLAKGRGETFTIVMTDGNRVHGTLLRADSANIAWSDVTTHEIHKVPTFLVHHLELTRNYVWEGGTVGLLAGAVPFSSVEPGEFSNRGARIQGTTTIAILSSPQEFLAASWVRRWEIRSGLQTYFR